METESRYPHSTNRQDGYHRSSRQLKFGIAIGTFLLQFLCAKGTQLHAQEVRWYWSDDPAVTKSIERVEALLQEPAPPGPRNTPLQYALKNWDIPILFDSRALEDEGVSLDTLVSVELDDASMNTMLNLILNPLNLTYVPGPNYLMVTNRRNSANRICVYDVERLIRYAQPMPGSGKNRFTSGNFNEIMRVVETTVDPEIWTSGGGLATMIPYRGNGKKLLVISAPTESHRAIQAFFRTLDRTEGIETRQKHPNSKGNMKSQSGSKSSLTRSSLSRSH